MDYKPNKVKKLTILFIFLITSWTLPAPDRACCYIERAEPINIYEILADAVYAVESSRNPLAYNPEEDAVGGLQIRPIRLKDYNKRTGKNYTHEQMYDYEIAKSIFIYYAQGKSLETAARRWSGSGPMTDNYWRKVKKHL